MKARALAKELLPPALFRLAGRMTGRSLRFTGAPADWAEALRQSSGYADESIVERVSQASREVIAGRAAYERDSVLFAKPALPFQLLAPLLRQALRHGGQLEVIDFGGALGGTYRRCRPFLSPLSKLTWYVIEQPGFVAAGRAEFTTDELAFLGSVAELPASPVPRVVLASSVLQYLEDPAQRLAQWSTIDADMLIIDRSPLSEEPRDHLSIQAVPRHIYPASYPCWIFSRDLLVARLETTWNLVAEFDCPEGLHVAQSGHRFAFKGLILEKRS